MAVRTLAFRLRGLDGCVRVRYVLNDDPRRWGYDRLELDFEIDTARGFPVIEGRIEYPAEGYAGYLGWVQVVRYWVEGQVEPTVVAPDVAPQMKDWSSPASVDIC